MHAVKLYPAGATTNSDAGVTDLKQLRSDAGAHGGSGPAAAGAWRGDRSGGGRLRSRGACSSRRVLLPLLQATFRGLKLVLEHITTQDGVAFRQGPGRQRRRHADGAPPAAQPQRHVRRRHASAPLLPAGAEARDASPGAGRALPSRATRSSSSAPTRRHMRKQHQGGGLRLRRLLHGASPASNFTPRSSRRPARWSGSKALPAISAPTITACRATPTRSRW